MGPEVYAISQLTCLLTTVNKICISNVPIYPRVFTLKLRGISQNLSIMVAMVTKQLNL